MRLAKYLNSGYGYFMGLALMELAEVAKEAAEEIGEEQRIRAGNQNCRRS